jgi:hypothetical protein
MFIFKPVSLALIILPSKLDFIHRKLYIAMFINDYRRVLDWMIRFIAPYTFITRDYM